MVLGRSLADAAMAAAPQSTAMAARHVRAPRRRPPIAARRAAICHRVGRSGVGAGVDVEGMSDSGGTGLAEPAGETLERHRVELTAYCYRMLGSAFDAEDAVQETLTRAWRGLGRFERRATLRTWLYRIAGNVCLDMLSAGRRRARPMDLSGPGPVDASALVALAGETWIEPIPDDRVLPAAGDPGELALLRETVRLAFIAALQHLPPRQRAVLILREVLGWSAAEVAGLLETSVPSVNSALQRARATMASRDVAEADPAAPDDPAQRELLARYVDAFQRYDMDALTALIHEDATQSMPPYDLWLAGREAVLGWWVGPGAACRGSVLVPVAANGVPAFGQYKPSGPDGAYEPWAVQVLQISGGRVTDFTFFLDTDRLFPLFGLPDAPPGDAGG
jgi:RNA polymerase sigma-70 factor, ECF subfamily